jgi:site-specific DNA recombinase
VQRYAIYCRVSSDEQQERGTIENQIEFATKYCDLHQLNIIDWYKDDGVTGTIPLEERPEGTRLLQDAQNSLFDIILVYKLDRFSRAARIVLNAVHELGKSNVQVRSMTEPFDTSTPSGQFALTVLAGVAELDRANILERMWHGANRAARLGKWLGGIVPYGYIVNEEGFLEINETPIPGFAMTEAAIVKMIFSLCTEQHMSTIKISDYLNALGLLPSYALHGIKISRGKRKENTAGIWAPHQIGRMLKNSTYKGIHFYGKRSNKKRELIARDVPAIIEPDVWEKAQTILSENMIDAMRNKRSDYLLSGLIKCGLCNHNYIGSAFNAYPSGTKKYYLCIGKQPYRTREKCKSKNVPADWLDDLVWKDCVKFINNPGETIHALDQHRQDHAHEGENIRTEYKLFQSSLAQKDSERESILDLFRKKLISSADVESQLTKIRDEAESLKQRLSDIETQLSSTEKMDNQLETAEDFLNSLRNKIKDGNPSFEQKREIIKAIVKKVIINTEFINEKPHANVEVRYVFCPPELQNTRTGIS